MTKVRLTITLTMLCISVSLISIAQFPQTTAGYSAPSYTTDGSQGPVSFVIGNKAYAGTGSNTQEFWEYDAATNVWTRKTDFPGAGRLRAVAFSIGNKGYIGTGSSTASNTAGDFWEYDPATNQWTAKASIPVGRRQAVGFSIGNKGYVGTGATAAAGFTTDFWEFDPIANTWTQKASLPGTARRFASGFAIGNKGYLGVGFTTGSIVLNDFWEYDPTLDTWAQKADFAGAARTGCVGFSSSTKGYIGAGTNLSIWYGDIHEYDPLLNTWTNKGGVVPRSDATGFAINDQIYAGLGLGTGNTFLNTFRRLSPYWEVRNTTGDYDEQILSGSSTCYQYPSQYNGTWAGYIECTDNGPDCYAGSAVNTTQNLGNLCYRSRVDAAPGFRGSAGWYGGTSVEDVRFCRRNYQISFIDQPTAPVGLRLMYTKAEIDALISNFNSTFGSSKTYSDLRIIKYSGPSEDLDPSNNSTNNIDYTQITPSLSYYGNSNEFVIAEFNVSSYSEFYLGLTQRSRKLYVNDNSLTGDVFSVGVNPVGNDANNGTPSSPFATISHAVLQAIEGDTIYVDAGTYTEQVTLDKGITIIGAGQDLTSILKPAITIAPTNVPPSTFAEHGVIQTNQSSTIGDVHISNLSVTGDYTVNVTPFILQTGGSVKNCKIQNGNQGIFVRIDPAIVPNARTFVIDGNTINAEYIAVNFAGGSRLTATLTNNNIAAFNPGFSSGTWVGADFGTLSGFTATGNTFSSYVSDGMFVNTNNGIITQNRFLGSGQKAINKSGGSTINATCNWYGTSDQNAVIPKLTSGISYSPWLTNGADNDVAIGFQPLPGVCNGRQNKFYVNDNVLTGDVFSVGANPVGSDNNSGIPSAPLASIITAYSRTQAGDTIFVDAGNYILPNVLVDKAITILGTNYLINPNDATNPLLTNASRNTETTISESTLTIGADNIKIEGLTLNPGNKSAVVLSNTSFGNFKFSRNKGILNSGNFIFLNGTAAVSPAIPTATGYDFTYNRFEKAGTTSGTTFYVASINYINIDKNSFVVTGPTPRTQLAAYFGPGGLANDVRFTDNVVDRPSYYMFTFQISQMLITGNKFYNGRDGIFIQGIYAGSSDIKIHNNYIENTSVGNSLVICRIFNGANPGSTNIASIKDNIINIDATGMTVLPHAITTQFSGGVLNSSLEVTGNKISHTGNYSLFTSSSVIGISLNGKNENSTVSNNELTFTGTNLIAPNPATPAALFTSGILLATDGGPTIATPASSVINLLNNKISGYKQSIALFDGNISTPNTYTGYGNLTSGITVNINNNSFSGDSISINNGNVGQSANASCNWYGSNEANIVLPKIGSNVIYNSWLTNATDIDVATGFQPAGTCNGRQNKFYVNDNNLTGDVFTTNVIGDDANTGIASSPLATLQEAVNRAQAGDTIFVDAGDYIISNIAINKSLWILGPNHEIQANDAIDKTKVNASRNAEARLIGGTLTMAADWIFLNGLRLTPTNTAIQLNADFSHIKFNNNYIDVATSFTTVSLQGVTSSPGIVAFDFMITGNRFERMDNGVAPMLFLGNVKNLWVDNNTFIEAGPIVNRSQALRTSNLQMVEALAFTNNYIKKTSIAVQLANLRNNVISLNRFDSCSQGVVFMTTATMPSDNVTISSNQFYNLRQNRAVLVRGGTNAGVSDLNINNNTINSEVNGTGGIVGLIQLEYAASNTFGTTNVTANTLNISGDYSLTGSGSNCGIILTGEHSNTNVTFNELNFSAINSHIGLTTGVLPPVPVGIFVNTDGTSSNGLIPATAVINLNNNKINGFKQSIAFYDPTAGLTPSIGYGYLTTGAIVNIDNNSFTGDSISINNGEVGQSVNANCNWYGSDDPNIVVPKIGKNVIYNYWLTDGTDSDVAAGFQPTAGTCNGRQNKLYVNDNDLTGDVFSVGANPIGNDNNSGLPSAPLASILTAYNRAQAGDTIYVDAGTYSPGNFTIDKSITILGTNYLITPNNPSDKLVYNTSRNAESIISNSIITFGADNINIEGLRFNTQTSNQFTLSSTAVANDLCKNIKLSKNRFVSSTTALNLFAFFGKAGILVTGGYIIDDNRMEEGAGANMRLSNLTDVTITNNSFIRSVVPIQGGLVAIRPQGPITNLVAENNTIQNWDITLIQGGAPIKNLVYNNNNLISCQRCILLNATDAQPSTLTITNNNITQHSTAFAPVVSIVRTAALNAVSPNFITIENNSITKVAAAQTTSLHPLIDLVCNNSSGAGDPLSSNFQVNIKRNKLNYSGDMSTATTANPYGIQFSGKMATTSIENNEITFTGTNLLQPAVNSLLRPTGIFINNSGSILPGAAINIIHNKVQGFKQSVAFYNGTQYGGLLSGTSVNINSNSFTGDSISINNGSTSQEILANCNWYGFASAQNILTKISLGTVDIAPWLTNGTDNEPLTTGFQPVPGACNGQPIQVNLDGYTTVTCNGANNGTISITVLNGFPPYQFTWTKDGNLYATSEDLANLAPGTYILTMLDGLGSNVMLDENGDILTIEIEITEPDVLTASATGDNNLCFAESNGTATVSVEGGTTPYTYLWSNGATTPSISNLTAGLYSVTVTDDNGCTAQSSYQVTEPALLTASITNNSSGCFNAATVTAAGGTEPYTYLWSNGAETAAISNIPAGTYNVTVTDDNGCTTNVSIILAVGEAFNPSASVTNVTCFGQNDGVITVTNANGTAPFTFSIDGINFLPGSLPYSFAGLPAGTHTVAVRDANGCTGFVSKTIIEPTALVATLNTVQSTCFGLNGGAINVSVTGGSPSYSYLWTGPNSYSSTQLNISGLAAGSYTLTVTDSKGCNSIVNAVVNPYPEILVSSIVTNVLCKNAANGSINLTVTGGTGSGFTYLWNTGITTEDRVNLGPANYSVNITDIGSGCVLTRSFTITQPSSIVGITLVSKADVNRCVSLGTLEIQGTGGTAPYQYKLDNGNYQSSGLFTGLAGNAGGLSYTAWVRDANGCTISKVYTIKDDGKDAYENNGSRGSAWAIPLATTISAKAVNADIDYFKLSNNNNIWAGNYTVSLIQPSPSVSYFLTTSNGTTIVTAADSSATYKQYNNLVSGNYYVRVIGGPLYQCYQLTITNGVAARVSSELYTKNVSPAKQVVEKLSAIVFPNPHQGNFNLQIESPENGMGVIQLLDANGKLVATRNKMLIKGNGNTVSFTNIRDAILFYRVILNKQIVTGKIIGQY